MSARPPSPAQERSRAAARSRVVLAALLGLLVHAAAAAEFGRVFFSPTEREALNDLRDRPPPTAAPAQTLPPPQRLDGILRRPDGRSIVWLDGEPHASPAGYRLAGGRALALIPDASPTIRLRVGDAWPRSDEAASQWPRIAVQAPPGAGR